ncbi:MAG: TldD/PmbA family protein [Chitinophagaceae bacterium]
MAILNKEEAKKLLEKVIKLSKADECEVSLSGNEGGNIRYARNAVSTSGDISTLTLTVNSIFGKKAGTASINEFDDAALERVVRRSEELAQLAPENPERMPLMGPQNFKDGNGYVAATAAMTPDQRADLAAKSLQVAKEAKLEAAGFLENTTSFTAILNSKGLYAYDIDTNVIFSVTTRNQEGTGSGYASRGFNDVTKLDTLSATKIAAQKANSSVNAKAIEPGKYTVILEPIAATYMLENMFRGFDARSADEGRSFMSKSGGGNRIGEQLMDEKVTVYSDPFHPELPGATWSRDGLPIEKMTWIEKGKVKNLSYSRFWADKKKVQPVPQPSNIIMEGGDGGSIEEMIKSTERGILITRLWYIRFVDPQTLLLTGLTRDGTFYIENGKIKYPIKNMRFNESPVIMLNNVESLGKPVRSISVESNRSYLIPPMKIKDFTFSSLSDAI